MAIPGACRERRAADGAGDRATVRALTPSWTHSAALRVRVKQQREYGLLAGLPEPEQRAVKRSKPEGVQVEDVDEAVERETSSVQALLAIKAPATASAPASAAGAASSALVAFQPKNGAPAAAAAPSARPGAGLVRPAGATDQQWANTQMIVRRQQERAAARPAWHAPWKLMRVISGHTGWVRALDVDVSNEFFATGSNDQTIKIWDLASGNLKLTLTGHIGPIRDLAISKRHPYMFSASEDVTVRCWDLEVNKVIRNYHGHTKAVYACAVHPTVDVLVTASRDGTVRVWDMRTRANVHTFTGHKNSVNCLMVQAAEPQIVSGSADSTVRLWDLVAGKCQATLTHHKKAIRSIVAHPGEYSFASASTDAIKKWKCPEGRFLSTLGDHGGAIVNTLAVNSDGVLFSGGNDGSMTFRDWKSGHAFQETQALVQPGSLDCEAGVLVAKYDQTGSRLLTGESDKTIKVYREDPDATPQTHPVAAQ